MTARNLDFNPAGGYLEELRARGLVRTVPAAPATAPAAAPEQTLSLAAVLRAIGGEPRPLDEVHRNAQVELDQLLLAIKLLVELGLVEYAQIPEGLGVKLTDKGRTLHTD